MDSMFTQHSDRPKDGSPANERRERRWWTVRRAAAHVGGGPKEIYRAVRVGRLKAVRLNRRGDIRTLPEWVDELMEQKRTDPLVMWILDAIVFTDGTGSVRIGPLRSRP